MSTLEIMFVLMMVSLLVILAAIILTVWKPNLLSSKPRKDSAAPVKHTVDFRSQWVECHRCGGRAFGVFGTTDVYRCRSCGYRTHDDKHEHEHTAEA